MTEPSVELPGPAADMGLEARWEALLGLLRPIHERALGTARRLSISSGDGDDLYQETVLRAFEKLPTLRDPARFRAWFYAVLLSIHRSRTRRGFWRRFLPLEETVARGNEPSFVERDLDEDEHARARRLRQALATLPPEQREAVVLFEIEGFSIEEIASLQGASVPAVKSRLARGRERLRRYYEKRGWGGGDRSSTERVPNVPRVAGGWTP